MALKRFLDDYFMIWTGGIKSLEIFLVEINNIHPNLKFTYNYSSPFDVMKPQKCYMTVSAIQQEKFHSLMLK